MNLNVIILAAGKGKRMVSQLPKVLHCLGGQPLLAHVVKTARALNAAAIQVVYGNGGDTVRETLSDLPVNWIPQREQLGTGHAVQQAIPACADDDIVLILYGDVPLISVSTLQQLLVETPVNGLGLVVAELPDPSGFGRIIRNNMANITAIVEHKDATPAQLAIKEINTGILTTQARHLKAWLPQLTNHNNQQEYYLTDIVALAVKAGVPVGGIKASCYEEIQGVNDRVELARLERYYQRCQAKALLQQGVQVMDPERLDIRGEVNIAPDVVLDVNVVLCGSVTIGAGCVIGANVHLTNVVMGERVMVEPMSVLEGVTIQDDCQIGPFARIRPGSLLETGAKVGNFVEIKKTHLGAGSKASHLTYLGDSQIGAGVNIGAGTITCNYDGLNKWPTIIGDGAFIGSNTTLVAPLTIGAHAFIGAGSTITQNAPADQLTLGRARQCTIDDWQRPRTPSDK